LPPDARDAPPAPASSSAPRAVLRDAFVSIVMRSSFFSQLPLKYPPRQAEYFFLQVEHFQNCLWLPALHNLAI
jgi:hypothetical protein